MAPIATIVGPYALYLTLLIIIITANSNRNKFIFAEIIESNLYFNFKLNCMPFYSLGQDIQFYNYDKWLSAQKHVNIIKS